MLAAAFDKQVENVVHKLAQLGNQGCAHREGHLRVGAHHVEELGGIGQPEDEHLADGQVCLIK